MTTTRVSSAAIDAAAKAVELAMANGYHRPYDLALTVIAALRSAGVIQRDECMETFVIKAD